MVYSKGKCSVLFHIVYLSSKKENEKIFLRTLLSKYQNHLIVSFDENKTCVAVSWWEFTTMRNFVYSTIYATQSWSVAQSWNIYIYVCALMNILICEQSCVCFKDILMRHMKRRKKSKVSSKNDLPNVLMVPLDGTEEYVDEILSLIRYSFIICLFDWSFCIWLQMQREKSSIHLPILFLDKQ